MNRSRRRLNYFIIALLGLTTAPLARAASSTNWQVVTAHIAQNKTLQTYRHVAITQWSLDGSLSGTRGNGAGINLASDDLVSLRRVAATQSPTLAQWRLSLRNGDSLVGTPSAIAAGAITMQSPLLGKLTFPLGIVAGRGRNALAADGAGLGVVRRSGRGGNIGAGGCHKTGRLRGLRQQRHNCSLAVLTQNGSAVCVARNLHLFTANTGKLVHRC